MQICNTKRRAYLHCAGITFADRMAAFCSFSAITGGKCGSNRGCVDFVSLNSCNADISSHLMNHHLSRENVCEMDLILARAGLLDGHVETQTMQTADCRLCRPCRPCRLCRLCRLQTVQTVQTLQTVQTVQTEFFFTCTLIF